MGIVTLGSLMNIIRLAFGKHLHETMVSKEIFNHLKYDKFQIEHIDKYYGMIGCVKDRTVRVFFDWEKNVKGMLSLGDIVIEIFYQPIVSNMSVIRSELYSEYVLEKVEHLNVHGKFSFSNRIHYFFFNERVFININYYPWTKTIDIKHVITEFIKILEENALLPFDIMTLDMNKYTHMQNYGMFLPAMEYLYKYLGENSNPYVSYQRI